VVRLGATAGEAVRAGQPLLWLEAMKMEHRIESPSDGVLTDVRVEVGQAVDTGALLAVVSSERDASSGRTATNGDSKASEPSESEETS
jgi:propionyl-CoA carboxylase alpha chain